MLSVAQTLIQNFNLFCGFKVNTNFEKMLTWTENADHGRP